MSYALSFPVPATGSLDQYIHSVNRMPMLSEQQEVDLATRLRDEGDVDAARQLVMSHLRVVEAIARGYLGDALARRNDLAHAAADYRRAAAIFDSIAEASARDEMLTKATDAESLGRSQ